MGGKQLDLALKNVIFSDSESCMLGLERTALSEQSTCRYLISNCPFWLVEGSCFQGSMMDCSYLVLLMYSLRGDSLKLRVLEEEIMISVVCSSCVEGKSSRNSFLHCLEAVASFLALSTGNASLFASSRVSNFRLKSLPPSRLALAGSSSKQAKKDVFSGEQWSLSDSAFLWRRGASGSSEGRLKRRDGCLRGLDWARLGKKSLGSLFLLILMRLVLGLGSLRPTRLPSASLSGSSSALRMSLFSLHAQSPCSI